MNGRICGLGENGGNVIGEYGYLVALFSRFSPITPPGFRHVSAVCRGARTTEHMLPTSPTPTPQNMTKSVQQDPIHPKTKEQHQTLCFATHMDPSCGLHKATNHILYRIGTTKRHIQKKAQKCGNTGSLCLDKPVLGQGGNPEHPKHNTIATPLCLTINLCCSPELYAKSPRPVCVLHLVSRQRQCGALLLKFPWHADGGAAAQATTDTIPQRKRTISGSAGLGPSAPVKKI